MRPTFRRFDTWRVDKALILEDLKSTGLFWGSKTPPEERLRGLKILFLFM